MSDDPHEETKPDAVDEYISSFGKPRPPLIKGDFTPAEEVAFKRMNKRMMIGLPVVAVIASFALGIAVGAGLVFYPIALVVFPIAALVGVWIGSAFSRFMLTRVGRRKRLGGGDEERNVGDGTRVTDSP